MVILWSTFSHLYEKNTHTQIEGEKKMNKAASISVLPDGCLSEILSLTSPRDACRASAISKGFNSAADSDAVWERFLPPDYHEIIAKAVSPVVIFGSKKQLHLFLSDSHIILDRGYLSFHVDKESGKKCYMLGAKELSIPWGGGTRSWEYGHIHESRFRQVSMLKDVWSLAIKGKIAGEKLSRNTRYVAYLVFRIIANNMGLDVPGKARVSYGGTEMETENVYLQIPRGLNGRRPDVAPEDNNMYSCRRKDGWMEIELGEFECNDRDVGEVEMAFDEHMSYKSGLIVEGIELRPK